MIVYGLISDSGDGSSSLQWFRTEAEVNEVLDDESMLEQWYPNEGHPKVVLTLPDDLDLVAAGFRFYND